MGWSPHLQCGYSEEIVTLILHQLTMSKITRKWRMMAEIYKRFSSIDQPEYLKYHDYSEKAMREAFELESYGKDFGIIRDNGKINGYIEGK